MKLLLDENLSYRIVPHILTAYPDSAHVKDFTLLQTADTDIWHFAQQHNFIITSKDADFHQKSLLWGHPPKVVYLRVGNRSTTYIIDLLLNRKSVIQSFITTDESLLVLG